MDFHPNASSCFWTFSSLRTFASNFFNQKSLFDFGVALSLHPLCRCQKQPCTKIANCFEGNTRSGFPGKSFLYRRYRNPSLYRFLLTISSGVVSFCFIRDMFALRTSAGTRSIVYCLRFLRRFLSTFLMLSESSDLTFVEGSGRHAST